MSVIDIDIGAYGFEEAERGLVRLMAMLTDLRPFWPKLVPLYIEWMGTQFEQQGGWGDGGAWAELSPDYAAWKTQHYPGKGILTAEGDLRHHAQNPRRIPTPTTFSLIIDPFTKERGPGAGRQIDPEWFQSGTANMPARPIIPDEIPLAAHEQVRSVAEAWVAEMAVRLGLT